uniref:SFRICE_038341 n=1 Tax=Spodoptera frugiperda TaxID=7108 RepID=A0A2H1WSX6_SPOFR
MDKKFIESVRQFPCLWDTRLTTYKSNETKDAAWAIIIKDTGLEDVKISKAKWKKLRDNHRDAIKRQSATRSGQATLKKLPNYLQLKVKRTAMNALLEAEELNEQNSWTAPHYEYFTARTETSSEPPLPPPSPGTDNEQPL